MVNRDGLRPCKFCGVIPSLRLVTLPIPNGDTMFVKIKCNQCGKCRVNHIPEICDWYELCNITEITIIQWNIINENDNNGSE